MNSIADLFGAFLFVGLEDVDHRSHAPRGSAFLDALRPLDAQSVENCIPTQSVRNGIIRTIVHNAQRTSVEFIRRATVTSDIPRHENRCP
ncbi:hypothetical protein F2S74_13975 [Pseudomonas syringae pv. actinidiae]|nr:hypothetical protein [Pseudomonas syringae pv. actinidiae]